MNHPRTTAARPAMHAVRVGAARGWAEFRMSLRNPEDVATYLLWGGLAVVYLVVNRNRVVEGTDLSFPVVAIPGILAAMVALGTIVGPAFTLVVEREDGTLLRAKAAPHGVVGYVTGQVVLKGLGVVPMFTLLLVASAVLFEDLMHRGWAGWLAVAGFTVLGFLAMMPIGLVLGSLARTSGQVTIFGAVPLMAMIAISGVVAPITSLAGWLQGIAQVLPLYWLGAAMRWAFLPDEAAAAEVGGSWQVAEAVGVLGLYAVVGLAVAPLVLRRMAQRESGSAVEARRVRRMQRVV